MSLGEYLSKQGDRLLGLVWEHAVIVGVALLISALLGVAIGVLVYRTELPRRLALQITGVALTIPSFALYGLLIAPLGLGAKPVVVALVMYALLPIVRNTVAGLRGVDPAVVDSAQGMGMGRWRRLWRIELPLAWPVIMTGIRVSAMILVGIAAIGAVINGPGLGKDIFRALARVGTPTAVNQAVAATLGILAIALILDVGFLILGKVTTSRGIRD